MAIPRSQSDGFAALLSGQNVKAIALLHNDSSPGAAYARIRALFRLRNFDRAIDFAKALDYQNLEYEEIVSIAALNVFVLARVGRLQDALLEMPRLEALIQPNDILGKLELQYVLGYLEYCDKRYPECLAILRDVLEKTSRISEDSRKFRFRADTFLIRAKCATLVGVIENILGNFSASERAHSDALLSAEQANPRDSFVEALILANLSCVVSVVRSESAMSILRDRARRFLWTEGLEEHRVYVDRHLRMVSFLFGDNGRGSPIAGRSAPSLAFRLAECIDSLLLDEWRSQADYHNELEFAKTFINRVDWQGTDGEEFSSLNEIIPLLAPFDLETSIDAKSRYCHKKLILVPHIVSESVIDQAHESFSSACIAKAEGNIAVACGLFENAISIWNLHGVSWRAAIASVELYNLNPSAALLEYASDLCKSLSQSPFSRRLTRAVQLAPSLKPGDFPYLRHSMC